MGAFCFIDKISEVEKNRSITAFFTLKGNEEFLRDHFKNFPVMPGVLILESLKQAAALLLSGWESSEAQSLRLEEVNEVKFGQFVKPDSLLRIFAQLVKIEGPRAFLEGRVDLMDDSGHSIGRVLRADFSLVSVL